MNGGTFSVFVWRTTSGAPIAQLRAPHSGAWRMWFTPRGDSIVMTGHFDSTLVVSALPGATSTTRERVFTAVKNQSTKNAFLFGAITDSVEGIPRVDVTVFADSSNTVPAGRTFSDDDGLFVLDSLPPGAVYVRALRIGNARAYRKVELHPGVNSIELTMPRDTLSLRMRIGQNPCGGI
jgi:hypothetical protein